MFMLGKYFKQSIFTDGSYQLLWAPSGYKLNQFQSYLRSSKIWSSYFFYMAVVLSFGVLCPSILIATMIALCSEALTYLFIIRRFTLLSLQVDRGVEHPRLEIEQILTFDLEYSMSIMEGNSKNLQVFDSHLVSDPPLPTNSSSSAPENSSGNTNDEQDQLSKYNSEFVISAIHERIEPDETPAIRFRPISVQDMCAVLNEECRSRKLKIIWTTNVSTVCSSLFMGCILLDMASTEYANWSHFVWIPVLSIFIPILWNYLIYKYRSTKFSDFLSEKNEDKIELRIDKNEEGTTELSVIKSDSTTIGSDSRCDTVNNSIGAGAAVGIGACIGTVIATITS
jgi:hypothetical protein